MTGPEIRVGDVVWTKIAELGDRSGSGDASRYDFIGGPLAAALLGFRAFDQLPAAAGPSVRQFDVIDPAFGPVFFIGVALQGGVVEIADFAMDIDYWDAFASEPGE